MVAPVVSVAEAMRIDGGAPTSADVRSARLLTYSSMIVL